MRAPLVALIGIFLSQSFILQSALAHPHVWVTANSRLIFDGESLVGVRHAWAFDLGYSAFAVQGLDENGDGDFTREELGELAQVNVESLSEFDFFTYIFENEVEKTFAAPVDYFLDWQGETGVLTLHFTLPLEKPIPATNAIAIEMYDPTIFVDFRFAEIEPVVLDNPPGKCDLTMIKPQPMEESLLEALLQIPADMDVPQELLRQAGNFANGMELTCNG